MTIDDFASRNKVKKTTVLKWINDELIPKADIENNFIPESARQPFTQARARSADAIYASMVMASRNRKHILPSLYKICDDEFNGYIDRLVRADLIEKRISDGITYYDATIKGCNANYSIILKAIKLISKCAETINKIGA